MLDVLGWMPFLKGDRRLALFCFTKLLSVWHKCPSKASLSGRIIIIIFIRINNYTYRVHIKHLSTNYIKIFGIENKLYYNNYFYKIIVIQYNI